MRLGEIFSIPIARLLSPILPGPYKPVSALAVARALTQTVPVRKGMIILSSDQLTELGTGAG